ncbi:MAG: Npt1/Npt2 family nucleotide transporter, partial [Zetaproteobacteria bacterium]|nr:Npt1/Npt2 family nucleotide transporter [Zetaproteobacteria bacterium]
LFTYLSHRLSFLKIVYIFLGLFLGYYLLFGMLLYPFTEYVCLTKLAEGLQNHLPSGFKGFCVCLKYWHISLFYICCEIWVTIILYILFWGFVNERVPFEIAGRWYPLLNFSGNFGSTLAGATGMWISKWSGDLGRSFGLSDDITMVSFATGICACSGLAMLPLYRHAYHSMPVIDPSKTNQSPPKQEDERVEIPFREALRTVVANRYVLFLLILVLAYNFIFNLTDVIWNQQVKDYFTGNISQMNHFMSMITLLKGVFSIGLALVAHLLIRHLGWRFAALITPMIILLTSIAFFPFVLLSYDDSWNALKGFFGIEQILLVVIWSGGLQNALARATKYSIYDSVREMAYVPMPHEARRKAKAILDGIGGRFGKAIGSIVFLILLQVHGSLQNSLASITVIAIFGTVFWVYAILRLSKLMEQEYVITERTSHETPFQNGEELNSSLASKASF